MHELAVVGALIEAVTSSLAGHPSARVETIRVRRGSAFSEDALRQGFELLSRGTPIEGARLEIEALETTVACPCGHSRTITADDLVGHMHVCPSCGAVQDLADVDDLELIDVALSGPASATGSNAAEADARPNRPHHCRPMG